MEIRYISITWTNCPPITRPNQYSALQSMVVMLQNDISKKEYCLIR
jgi:hypothetical protein